MAQRRMFTLKVVDTDAFLEMPLSSQALYFHLAMRADDDGFVSNPKKISRMLGTQDDDLKVLFGKKFILPFESGVVVIKHWRMHNYIQADRYQETSYVDEKSKLSIKDNGSYTNEKSLQDVSKMDTQVRLGKDRIGKVRIDKCKSSILDYWNEKQIIIHRQLSKDASKEIEKMLGYPNKCVENPDEVVKSICDAIAVYAEVLHGKDYWWTHKWNLYEFLKRGYKQFEGKSVSDYKKDGAQTSTDKI